MKRLRAKFHNIKCTRTFNNELFNFDSKAEAQRAGELFLLSKAGEIKDLMFQPAFVIQEKFRRNGKAIREIKYIADFQYSQNGLKIVEDVKGVKTKEYQIKKKMFLLKHGSEYVFREVFMKKGFSQIVEI